MNDALKMQISAFVDGELPQNESELLLRRLSQDTALRRQVAGYLQIGRLMRREREVPGIGELRNRIAAALGEQPAEIPATEVRSPSRFLKPAAGVAIAASVALVALVGLRQVDVPVGGELSPENLQAREASSAQSSSKRSSNSSAYTEPLPEGLSERPGDMLTQYYLSHGATSADLGANGILTRLVTLELREGELVEVKTQAPQTGAGTADESPQQGKRVRGNTPDQP